MKDRELITENAIETVPSKLTWPGLEPTIYRTRCKHANHYATDAVLLIDVVPGE
jgi:hypothetical protein